MGVFICSICGNYCDSHDGCEKEKPNQPADYNLICTACAVERESEEK